MTENVICEKAKALYTNLESKLPCPLTEKESFKVSREWFNNFKKKSGIHRDIRCKGS